MMPRIYTAVPAHVRVLRRIVIDERGCWVFQGARVGKSGHGSVRAGSTCDGTDRTALAHRVVYEALVGPVAAGNDIHHRCEEPRCVNPAHLAVLTHADHSRGHYAIDEAVVSEIRRRTALGETRRSIANDLGVEESWVSRIARGLARSTPTRTPIKSSARTDSARARGGE